MKSLLILSLILIVGCGGKDSGSSPTAYELYSAQLAPQVGETIYFTEAGEDHDFIIDESTGFYTPKTRLLYNVRAQTVLKVDGDKVTVLEESVINGSKERLIRIIHDQVLDRLKLLLDHPETKIENGSLRLVRRSTYYQNGSHPGQKIPLDSVVTQTMGLSSRCDFVEDIVLTDPKAELPSVTMHKALTCGERLGAQELRRLNLKRIKTCPKMGSCREEDMSGLVK